VCALELSLARVGDCLRGLGEYGLRVVTQRGGDFPERAYVLLYQFGVLALIGDSGTNSGMRGSLERRLYAGAAENDVAGDMQIVGELGHQRHAETGAPARTSVHPATAVAHPQNHRVACERCRRIERPRADAAVRMVDGVVSRLDEDQIDVRESVCANLPGQCADPFVPHPSDASGRRGQHTLVDECSAVLGAIDGFCTSGPVGSAGCRTPDRYRASRHGFVASTGQG
jgi:hypothetical protein